MCDVVVAELKILFGYRQDIKGGKKSLRQLSPQILLHADNLLKLYNTQNIKSSALMLFKSQRKNTSIIGIYNHGSLQIQSKPLKMDQFAWPLRNLVQ